MTPRQHLDWFEENITRFEAVATDELSVDVSNCPGWTVADVLNHLSFGVGVGYSVAVSTGPDVDDDQVFAGVTRPVADPVGPFALETFSHSMRTCLAAFAATDPGEPCWTYVGPGNAAFWFRRAAIETSLHRLDVEDALGQPSQPLPFDRVADGIREAAEIVWPLAAGLMGEPPGGLTISVTDQDLRIDVGQGAARATITGEGQPVFTALWGRHRAQVGVHGDHEVAQAWLSLIERAFAGR